ncbi:MAG: tetratricopeptide repeat protein [Halarsenatibacteraceae bacterium]
MKKLILIFTLFLVITLPVQAQNFEIVEGINSFYTGEYTLAEETFRQILNQEISSTEKYTVYSYLIKSKLKNRELTAAKDLIAELDALGYHNAELYWLLAEQYLNLEGRYDSAQFEPAKEYIEKARDYGFYGLDQQKGHAQAELGLNNYQAVKDILEPIRNELAEPSSFSALARAYKELDQPRNAIDLYERLIVLEPDNSGVHLELGNLYIDQKNYSDAIEVLEQGLIRSPDVTSLKFALGRAYKSAGIYEKAIENFNQVINSNQHNYEAHYQLGLIFYEEGEIEQAVESLETAIRYNNEYVTAYLKLGEIYLEEDNHYRAVSYFSSAVEINPDYALSYYYLGRAYFELELYQSAQSELVKALRRQPDLERASELLDEIDEIIAGLTEAELEEIFEDEVDVDLE